MFKLKTKETFLNEIKESQREHGFTILEAIAEYMVKYSLDENYINKNFISNEIKQELERECEELNLLKSDNGNS